MKPRMAHAWLLGVCVLLCLSCGANALKCSVCTSGGPEEPCLPHPPKIQTCSDDPHTGHPAACVLYTISATFDGTTNVMRYYKKCGFYTKVCGTRKVDKDVRQEYELKCCNDRDHCL